MAQARKGNRQQPPPDDNDDEGGDAFTDDQRTEITNLVNAAVSGQLQRKLPKAITEGITGPLGELRTLIEGQQNRRGRVANDDDNNDDDEEIDPPQPQRGKGKSKGGRRTDPDPEKEQMRKRLDAIEAERKVEREQNRNRERDGSLRESLTKLGVDPNRVRGAIAVLRDSTKYDEKTGEWSYTAKRDGFDEEIDLHAGAAEWIKTDEGKSYVAAPAGQQPRGGSGTRLPAGGSGGPIGGGKPIADPKAAKAQAKAAAVDALVKATGELGGSGIAIG